LLHPSSSHFLFNETEAMASSALGIEIRKGSNPKWRVGKKVGSGACATVHALEEIDGTATEFAIKLAPIPVKTTKKKNSEAEINATRIYYEHVVYRNQFQDILGEYLPNLPSYSKGPPSHGEAGGYRYLIMEKMQQELSQIVPLLLRKASGPSINFGPIATQLLACIQAIQERKHVVLDVKAENFMLAAPTARRGKGPSSEEHKLASRIRLLDLALVQPWSSIGSHRANEGTSGLAGTPLYASINIHNGETPSRRDDLESLGYVIAELIIRLASGDESKQLPWSNGRSDEEIGSIKENQVNNMNSSFYKELGSCRVAKVFTEYMDEIRGYAYKKQPDYGKLSKILIKLKIPFSSAQKPAAARAKKAAPVAKAISTRTKRTTRTAPVFSTNKASKSTATAPISNGRVTRSQKRAASPVEEPYPQKVPRDDTFMEVDVIELSDDEVTWTNGQPSPQYQFHDALEDSFETATMDWEESRDENEEPVPAPASKPKAIDGVTIVIEDGPHKGFAINLIKGRTIVVGSNPTTKAGEIPLILSNDDDVDGSHIQLNLTASKKLISVCVTDLKSSGGSYVGNEKIRKGKDYKIFRGDSVRIGNSKLTIKALDPNVTVTSSNQEMPPTTKKKSSARAQKNQSSEPQEELPRLKRRGVLLMITQGPHVGESYELEQGKTESFVVGTKPSSKTGTLLRLNKDKGLKATHVRLDLTVNKRLTTVAITDKSKGETIVNRDTVNKGKAFINDIIRIGESVLQVKTL
jgi:pSer/pThr/pTyr-binding forkhead associated (FHA) protein